jgi:hypothetical protein
MLVLLTSHIGYFSPVVNATHGLVLRNARVDGLNASSLPGAPPPETALGAPACRSIATLRDCAVPR